MSIKSMLVGLIPLFCILIVGYIASVALEAQVEVTSDGDQRIDALAVGSGLYVREANNQMCQVLETN